MDGGIRDLVNKAYATWYDKNHPSDFKQRCDNSRELREDYAASCKSREAALNRDRQFLRKVSEEQRSRPSS
jgi:hypothetical protein